MYHHERGSSPLGHETCTYLGDFGHTGTSPGLRLPPAPGDQPAGSPPFFRCCGCLWAHSARMLACVADDGGHGVGRSCLQGPGPRVVGERDLPGAQVADRVLSAGRPLHVGSAAGTASPAPGGRFCPGQEHVQGGQVRQDPVLADVQVPRPRRVRRRGARVPVTAPVGGPIVRPA